MKFGLFYEHQLPRPYDQDDWDPDAEHQLLRNALDQLEPADQLGRDEGATPLALPSRRAPSRRT